MIHSKRAPAIVLLVALAFVVGVPPPLSALERPPEIFSGQGYGSGQTTSGVAVVSNDGDPDDWASNAGGQESADGLMQGKPSDDDGWLGYLESIRGLILRIKLGLDGIL